MEDDIGRVLTTAVGLSEDILVHSGQTGLQPGDRVLMTTDGVHDSLSADELTKILHQRGPAREILERLLRAALRVGSRDNVTAVLIEFGAE